MAYYVTDHLGTVVQTTNAAGAVSLSRDYDPYGNPIAGSTQSGYAFTGREWDAETGLYYYRARYQDPKLARFLTEDPIGLKGGYNLYAYVENRPTVLLDPEGLKPTCGPILKYFFARLNETIRKGACQPITRRYESPDFCECHECTVYPDRKGLCPKKEADCQSFPWPECILGVGGPTHCFTGEPNPDWYTAKDSNPDPDAPDINKIPPDTIKPRR